MNHNGRVWMGGCVALWMGGLVAAEATAADDGRSPMPFVDIAAEAGVLHRHHKPVLDSKLDKIMPWMASVGSSCAAADYDQDGDVDLYVTNSRLGKPNRLFRNRGDGTFEEVGARAGVDRANQAHGVSMDAVWGDYDNDGHLDLYVVKWGWNILYHNNGDGTFADVTDTAGVGDRGNGNAAVWFDHDDDNDLDLYVGNYFRYVDLWNLEDSRQMHESFETARDAGPNVFYRNNGDGTFTETAAALGIDDTGWTLDVGCADYDNDGDLDLVLANDFGHDRVFRNNGDGTFTNVTVEAIGFDTYKGMNVDFGDYNNDGFLDLYVTNIWTKEYVKEGNQLYRNMGDGTFSDVSFETQVYDAGWAWAGRFWDYDNDGDLDLICANGYISGNPDDEYFKKLAVTVTQPGFDPVDANNWPEIGDSTFAGHEPMRVWRNEGNEAFTELAARLGLADTRDGRGLAVADFDNDGDLDVYVSNQGQTSGFYRNDIGNRNHWLQIELVGTNCNRDAIGARVTLVSEGLTQIRELDGGNGDHSQNPYRLHFGLGRRKTIDRLEIRWPHGYVQRLKDVKLNQILRITENAPPAYLEQRRQIKQAAAEARRRRASDDRPADAGGTGPAEGTTDWSATAAFKKEYLKLRQAVAGAPNDPRRRYDFAVLLDRGDRREGALEEMEQAVTLDPQALRYANAYRSLARKYGPTHCDRAIRFFEDLLAKHPDSTMVRLNAALAYVDKMPSPMLGIVRQGTLSNKSIAQLNRVLEKDPACWAARFIRGMNHLHWPRKLGHLPLAIADFTELIPAEADSAAGAEAGAAKDRVALAYVCLGDAHVKNRDQGREECLAKAREVWQRGLARFPDSAELRERLEMMGRSTDELIQFVERLRGLEDPVNTDLARIWVE